MKENFNTIAKINEELFGEIYVLNSAVNMVRNSCFEKENKSIYYGLVNDGVQKISNERNDYINMLTVAADKISNVISLNLAMEKELSLYQDSNDCSR